MPYVLIRYGTDAYVALTGLNTIFCHPIIPRVCTLGLAMSPFQGFGLHVPDAYFCHPIIPRVCTLGLAMSPFQGFGLHVPDAYFRPSHHTQGLHPGLGYVALSGL